MMPELTSQEQAQTYVLWAAWCLYEQDFLQNVTEAGCSLREAEWCMNTEVN